MESLEFKIRGHQTETIQFLDDKIYEYNSSAIGKYPGDFFTKVIRDENNNIIAGITGLSWAGISEG